MLRLFVPLFMMAALVVADMTPEEADKLTNLEARARTLLAKSNHNNMKISAIESLLAKTQHVDAGMMFDYYSDVTHEPIGSAVPFPNERVNINANFDGDTFVASVHGVYYFAVTAGGVGDNSEMRLSKNGGIYVTLDRDNTANSAASAIMELVAGDAVNVWLQAGDAECEPERPCVFSGFLIKQLT